MCVCVFGVCEYASVTRERMRKVLWIRIKDWYHHRACPKMTRYLLPIPCKLHREESGEILENRVQSG